MAVKLLKRRWSSICLGKRLSCRCA